MHGDDQRCFEAGMNDYITKPIDRARLLGKVGEWGYQVA
jgi:CheY-like chemotaxis protein